MIDVLEAQRIRRPAIEIQSLRGVGEERGYLPLQRNGTPSISRVKDSLSLTVLLNAEVGNGMKHARGSVPPGLMCTHILNCGISWNTVLRLRRSSPHEFGPKSFHIEAQIGDSVIVLETGDPPHPEGTPVRLRFTSRISMTPNAVLLIEALLPSRRRDANLTRNETPECGIGLANTQWIAKYRG
jgi:hypothetical protein